MATSTSNLKAILLAAGLALSAGPVTASDYPFFPDTTLGKTYYWKNYRVNPQGKLDYLGVITNTVAGTQLINGHVYIVVSRQDSSHRRMSDIEFRCDDDLCGTLDGNTEDSLVVKWQGTPKVGQTWSKDLIQTVVRKQEDVEVDGVVYPDCLVVDRLDNGHMTNRSYFSPEQGWIKSVFYYNGKVTAVGYRTSKESAYRAN